MGGLLFAFEFTQNGRVDATKTLPLDVIVLMHVLDARGDAVDELLLLGRSGCEQAAQLLRTYVLSLLEFHFLQFGM